ncbi:Pre-rRNA-processing protein TSR2-domain-containing protein [Endogone sp. FLAS-F59071]|nr:Pre-rRNA-processing protein TSR2-domain-containing protein [Endogone sp. FLAS-F59071]|eukprot:RUS20418.1 Pre-rRNA-processing protein TSR2-domain-containing protein [Endogone sp. FLAS-F59071]
MAHPNQVAFTDGVSCIFRAWTALKLAVDLDWGGPDSAEKRAWFVDIVVEQFQQKGKKLDAFELEDILSQIMQDEFSVTLEDDSAYAVSQHIVKIYNECIQGDYTSVNALRDMASSKAPEASRAANDDSDGGDDDEEEEGEGNGNDRGEGPSTIDGDVMDVDADTAPSVPIIDEDGFELVARSSRRKNRK